MPERIINTEYIHVVKNVFSDELVQELKKECDIHFEKNLLHSDKIEVTKCIIDCHGLALSVSSYFPYDKRCWNIFCLKIKKYVLEYFNNVGVDESVVVPHSCWAERSVLQQLSLDLSLTTFREGFRIVDDDWLKKHLVRSIYYLKNPDPKFGTDIKFGKTIKSIPGEENSLVVFDGGTHQCSNKFPVGLDSLKYNIVFDRYINYPFGVPDWVLP